MEKTRKAATAMAKMEAAEAMVTETMRAHSRHINIKTHIICLIRLCSCHVTKAMLQHTNPWNIGLIIMD